MKIRKIKRMLVMLVCLGIVLGTLSPFVRVQAAEPLNTAIQGDGYTFDEESGALTIINPNGFSARKQGSRIADSSIRTTIDAKEAVSGGKSEGTANTVPAIAAEDDIKDGTEVPDTGDRSSLLLWLLLMLVADAGIGVAVVCGRIRKKSRR